MTMTSMALGPSVSLVANNMLGPKRCHLDSPSPSPSKGYDALLRKGKKSWSVRLGLSRGGTSRQQQQQQQDAAAPTRQPQLQQQHHQWGTVSGAHMLAQQIYYDPYLYGTVRGSPSGPRVHAITPVLLVCSCNDFLRGTATRNIGSPCRKCHGHRLPEFFGGTCRVPSSGVRARPSLAGLGMLSKPGGGGGCVDDPYERLRRNRLEPESRSRARSSSPLRLPTSQPQRDVRSQSAVGGARGCSSGPKQVATVEPMSRSEWYTDGQLVPSVDSDLLFEDCANRSNDDEDVWSSAPPKKQEHAMLRSQPGRSLVRYTSPTGSQAKPRSPDGREETSSSGTIATASSDSRKSILECDVNPYLLLTAKSKSQQPQRNEDELSGDELSDNAVERELLASFDPSKVKSIERTASNCRSSVAAIGGQRVRLFHEPCEPSDEDEEQLQQRAPGQPGLTRIPIPKVSPKRPPRRPKPEVRGRAASLRSILKRGADRLAAAAAAPELRRKSVLFNVDNVILAPEKPASDSCSLGPAQRKSASKCSPAPPVSSGSSELSGEGELSNEAPIEEHRRQHQPHRFISIPNIRSPPKPPPPPPPPTSPAPRPPEAKIAPRLAPPVEKIKIDKFVPSKKQQLHHQHQAYNRQCQRYGKGVEEGEEEQEASKKSDKVGDPKAIAVDEKDLRCQAVPATSAKASTSTCLIRSQSERSSARPEISAADVGFVDTMRLSLFRGRAKNEGEIRGDAAPEELARGKMSFEEAARRRFAVKRESKIGVLNESIDEEQDEKDATQREESGSWQKVREPASKAHFVGESPVLVSEGGVARASSAGDEKPAAVAASNVCKITVNPLSVPPSHLLVHRLQVSSTSSSPPPRATSIVINGGGSEQDLDNKVTISVGSQNGLCNPTIISVNSGTPNSLLSIQQSSSNGGDQKRTLVILDNYKSNIVIGSDRPNQDGLSAANEGQTSRPIEMKKFQDVAGEESPEEIVDAPASKASKEEIISKLLEDSLRKARENGEILDESSGEAILKILKQSLLKSSAAAASKGEPVEFAGYLGPSRTLNSSELVSSSNERFFAEENAYEVIKEPIYEEIPDEPPPLPTSPPPSDVDYKNRIFFADEYIRGGKHRDLGTYYESLSSGDNSGREYLECSYLSKRRRGADDDEDEDAAEPFKSSTMSEKLLNFILDSEKCARVVSLEEEEEEEEDEEDEDEEDEDEDEEDPERDLEALYEQQKETSLGDLSSKSSQISNVSDSSEECNIILTNSPEAHKTRTVDIERTDSGVGSESSQASSGRGIGRRWRSANNSHHGKNSGIGGTSINVAAANGAAAHGAATTTLKPTQTSGRSAVADAKQCEDCEQRLEPLLAETSVQRSLSTACCRKCGKKRAERKEIITEIVETEQKYGRDLQIILEEFHRPMLRAGLLTHDQLSAIFLNVEELLEHNQILADKLKEAVGEAQGDGDEDLVSVDLGKIFLESERMLHAFESYCTRQGSASLLLQNLEKEKELLRIFLKVSQMENAVLRRMNLNSFLMVPVQRVTKYPLLLARLQKATPSGKPQMQELKKRLKEAQTNIELHLEHMNAEAKDITSTKLWRRISIIQQNGRRSSGEQDMVNIKLRKMAVEVLEWPHEDSRFVLEGRLLVAQPTDNNWRRGRTVKLAPITAMLVTRNGKPNNLLESLEISDDSLFPARRIGVKDATLLLVKEKLGRYSLLREPLYLDKCIVCSEADIEDYFEIQELSSKETFIFKAEDGGRTKRWCRTLQAHAQSLGAWRRRRGALPNIMICGVARS